MVESQISFNNIILRFTLYSTLHLQEIKTHLHSLLFKIKKIHFLTK